MSNQNERGVERVGRGLHISRKIYMSIVSIFLVCVCLLCATTIVFMWMYISRQEKAEVERLEGQIISEFSSLNDEAEKLCDLIGNNYDIQTIIREPASDDWTARAQERCIVNGKIALLAQSYTHRIDNVALFLLDGRQFKYGKFGPRSDSVLDEEWFQSILDAGEFTWLGHRAHSLALHSLEWDCVVAGMPVLNLRTNEPCGVVVLEMSTSALKDIVDSISDENNAITLADGVSGEEIYCSREFAANRGVTDSCSVLQGMFEIATCVNDARVRGWSRNVIVLMATGTVILFLLLLRFSLRSLNRSVTRPIEELQNYVDVFDNESLPPELKCESDVIEITQLQARVKKLLERIRVMLETSKEEQKTIRRAQVAALQAQINPHFLYNTLDSISWLIRMNENQKALETLHAFSGLFRLALSNGKSYLTVRDELNYVQNYIKILNVRYSDQIAFEMQIVDESVLDDYIPKLLLQPIVENAIEHGIGMTEDQRGTIQLRVQRCDGGVCFNVRDDGVGIPEEQLRQIRAAMRDGEQGAGAGERKSYGIYNVNNRLRISYGAQYGLSFVSEYGKYTSVSVVSPLCNSRGEVIL